MTEIFTISVIVFAIWYSFQVGEVFGAAQKLKLGKLANPLRDCPVCMTPWFGIPIYFIACYPLNFIHCILTLLAATGVNVILISLFPDKETPGVHHELGEISEAVTDLTQWLKEKSELRQPGPKFHPKNKK